MAVTKQTYTATATWTASQLADIFRSAFIDAGLMTEWHDSFLSGSVENRVLRVQYDAAKAYGTTFYWFMFTTSEVALHVATGWNTSTDQPTGTQYLDYFATTTNSTTNHWSLLSAGTSVTVELVRYTSQVDNKQSWFVVKTGTTTRRTFAITAATSALQPWLDLDKGFYNGFVFAHGSVGLTTGNVQVQGSALTFALGPGLRRCLLSGTPLNGSTTRTNYNNAGIGLMAYSAFGNLANSYDDNTRINHLNVTGSTGFLSARAGARAGSILLPINFSGTNPAFASSSVPVFHSMPATAYTVSPMSADFGITFHYATNTFSLGDTFVVSSGTEEWEVLEFATATSSVTHGSPLFLARTI